MSVSWKLKKRRKWSTRDVWHLFLLIIICKPVSTHSSTAVNNLYKSLSLDFNPFNWDSCSNSAGIFHLTFRRQSHGHITNSQWHWFVGLFGASGWTFYNRSLLTQSEACRHRDTCMRWSPLSCSLADSGWTAVSGSIVPRVQRGSETYSIILEWELPQE